MGKRVYSCNYFEILIGLLSMKLISVTFFAALYVDTIGQSNIFRLKFVCFLSTMSGGGQALRIHINGTSPYGFRLVRSSQGEAVVTKVCLLFTFLPIFII